jgi:CBS domain-containing protein
MNIAAILKAKGREVATLPPQTSLEAAARFLTDRGIGSAVVVDAKHHILGIISERDIVRAIALGGAGRLEAPVSEVMTTPVHTAREADTIDYVMALMTQRRFRHVPIVEGKDLVGIVSIGDVVKMRIAEAEMEAEAMRSYITSG